MEVTNDLRNRFNSRPSCEGRLGIKVADESIVFQFTPLMRGATVSQSTIFTNTVSIHAPHARGDRDKS